MERGEVKRDDAFLAYAAASLADFSGPIAVQVRPRHLASSGQHHDKCLESQICCLQPLATRVILVDKGWLIIVLPWRSYAGKNQSCARKQSTARPRKQRGPRHIEVEPLQLKDFNTTAIASLCTTGTIKMASTTTRFAVALQYSNSKHGCQAHPFFQASIAPCGLQIKLLRRFQVGHNQLSALLSCPGTWHGEISGPSLQMSQELCLA